MKKHLLASLSVLVLSTAIAGYAAPASAAIVYITVTGTVASGYDNSGLFGKANANLAGDSYTAQYEFNTNLGYSFTSDTQNYGYGGSSTSYTSPSLGASLTINGRSFLISGTYRGDISGRNVGNSSESYVEVRPSSAAFLYNDLYGPNGNSPASITTAFSITSAGETFAGGGFDYGATSLELNSAVYTESLTAPVAPAVVPEPASMALLGIGLLGTGMMARRRSSAPTATAG